MSNRNESFLQEVYTRVEGNASSEVMRGIRVGPFLYVIRALPILSLSGYALLARC